MKVTFYSNYMNHHQLDISKQFIELGIDYTFVATTSISQERLNLGYEDMNKKYEFVLTAYESQNNYTKALELALTSDIVIIGSASDEFIKERLKQNKITFRYAERIFKKGRLRIKNIKNILVSRIKSITHTNKRYYLLCASAYAAKDYSILGLFKNKCYRWGYFPNNIKYDIDELIKRKENNKVKIIWVGRFIDWKHPEYAVDLAEALIAKSCKNFEIVMLGNGEMLDEMAKKIEQKELQEYIKVMGSVPSADVRKYMEESNIHIFTSDKGEGWGAVLNESMNSACAVVANKEIGSAPYLIENGKNGLLYSNKQEFINNVIYLIENSKLREAISKAAYNTIDELWNSKNAVNKLLQLYENILFGYEKNSIKKGPCSKDIDYL